jgi:hypothetical protein
VEKAEQRRVLAEMGIDIWVRREIVASAGAESLVEADGLAQQTPKRDHRQVEASSPKPQARVKSAEPALSTAVVAEGSSAADERFKLHTVSLDGVLAIGEVDSAEDLRLVGDVVKAMSGFNPADPETYVFEWPQQAEVTDIAAAGRAFDAFLKARVEALTPTHLVLFGDRPVRLLFGEDVGFDKLPETHLGAGLCCFDQASALRRNPDRKRTVWQAISNRRSS